MNMLPWTALLLGAAGSLHCIGMCGPIALALPVGQMTQGLRIAGILAYNFGRAFLYSVLGFFSGLAGSAISWMGGQQTLSVVAGLIILAALLAGFAGKKIPLPRAVNRFYSSLRSMLGKLFQRKTVSGLLLIGLLNGLLPCGLVYAALAGAAATGSAWQGALFMFTFGLGTIPAMFALPFAGTYFSGRLRSKLRRWVPVFVGVMAVFLILRGMDLGIPYISPSVEKNNVCCHR